MRDIDPADMVGVAELAARFDVRRQTVCNWHVRYEGFPLPLVTLACGPIYLLSEVENWRERRQLTDVDPRDSVGDDVHAS